MGTEQSLAQYEAQHLSNFGQQPERGNGKHRLDDWRGRILKSTTGARTFLSAAGPECSTIRPSPRGAPHSDAAADRNVRAPASVRVARCTRSALPLPRRVA